MRKKLTCAVVNKELARLGYTERLTRGNGYYYFYSGNAAEWPSSSIPVFSITHMKLQDVIDWYHELRNEK